MQDRLSEFFSGVGVKDGCDTVHREKQQNNIELGFIKKATVSNPLIEPNGGMEAFEKETEEIKSALTTMRNNVDMVQSLYIKTISSVNNDKIQKFSSELDTLLEITNSIAKDIKTRLDRMQTTIDGLQKSNPSNPAELKIRTNQKNALSSKFQELVLEYQTLQSNYKDKVKEKIRRQYLITRPDASEKEIESVVNETDGANIFLDQIVQTQATRDAVQYITDRRRDIAKLEKSIRELHQLFTDMTILVDQQGELLNHIEYNVSTSEAYAEQTTLELASANRRRRRARKRAIILTILVIFLLAVIILPIVLVVRGNTSSVVP
eukprot:TRINITY_DN4812_c0_g1_i2.p1 TRINITY_DN4812_c0_g1~~TRINITY_DN4812_c0_g1_i2.p1  ORF type:complete len:321 (+),score=72.96 TRINITY_DN4812_c0_g1_i2:271-1233(+)